MSEVDFNYFSEIAANLPAMTHWYVTYYYEEDIADYEEVMNDLGIPENQITYLQLEEI